MTGQSRPIIGGQDLIEPGRFSVLTASAADGALTLDSCQWRESIMAIDYCRGLSMIANHFVRALLILASARNRPDRRGHEGWMTLKIVCSFCFLVARWIRARQCCRIIRCPGTKALLFPYQKWSTINVTGKWTRSRDSEHFVPVALLANVIYLYPFWEPA